MATPPHVLIIADDEELRNLFEQLFIIRGDTVVRVGTVQEANDVMQRSPRERFKLMIIDTTALGAGEADQQQTACRLLADWNTKRPALPLLFLGTVLQKYPLLAMRTRGVRFMVQPYHLDDLMNAIEELYPITDSPQNANAS